jgi:DNA-binding MarR family transcriptional regulator
MDKLRTGRPVIELDDYITETLMRDLVGHDRKPASFLVYLWLSAEQSRRGGLIRISYQELAESTGISKSSVQSAVRWLLRRRLIAVSKDAVTATPYYTVLNPWRSSAEG